MKLNIKTFLSVIILITLIILPACKTSLSVQLFDIWGVGIKVIGEDRSNFSAFVNIVNDTPELEGNVKDWSFKIYSGDSLLLEVNNNNYTTLGFKVEATLPAPSYYSGGNISIYFGIPIYKPTIAFVDTDIYAGKKPDKFDFHCTIQDINGDRVEVSSLDTPMEYLEYDPNQD